MPTRQLPAAGAHGETTVTMATAIDGLATSVDRVASVFPTEAADGEALVALVRQAHRLAAVISVAAASFERSDAWVADGARSPAAWIATRCRLPVGDVRRTLRLGRAVDAMPVVASAWFDGDIGARHVEVLAGLGNDRTAGQLARDEALLVEHAATLPYAGFRRSCDYWSQHADPDGSEDAEERRRCRRAVSLHQSFEGTWFGQVTLDPVSGAIVGGELDRIEQRMFEEDLAEAGGRLERGEPGHGDLRRTVAQRRADALVEMATRSRSAPDGSRRPAPLFSVLVDFDTLHGRICELANGTVLAPGALVPWLTQAEVERAVSRPGRRVEVSVASRFFTGGTRRAIELRDRTCTHPYCDRPATKCQVDHIVPWAWGGPTTQENGRLLCPYHNLQRNQRPPPDPDRVPC